MIKSVLNIVCYIINIRMKNEWEILKNPQEIYHYKKKLENGFKSNGLKQSFNLSSLDDKDLNLTSSDVKEWLH